MPGVVAVKTWSRRMSLRLRLGNHLPKATTKNHTILKEGKPPQDQVKLIVFEEAILNMFGKCSQCGSKCIVTLGNKIGSLCTIYSSCTINSRHYFEWETGPLVNRMPVFHLLFAAGTLATGMESAKAVRLFSSLKVPNVK